MTFSVDGVNKSRYRHLVVVVYVDSSRFHVSYLLNRVSQWRDLTINCSDGSKEGGTKGATDPQSEICPPFYYRSCMVTVAMKQ